MENKKEHKKRNIFSIFKNLKNNLNISKKYKIEAMKSQQKITNPRWCRYLNSTCY